MSEEIVFNSDDKEPDFGMLKVFFFQFFDRLPCETCKHGKSCHVAKEPCRSCHKVLSVHYEPL